MSWLAAAPLESARLRLEPLTVDHAEDAAVAFGDQRLHEFTGGSPLARSELRARYARQAVGQSADGLNGWLNWMLRLTDTQELVGTVQATLRRDRDGLSADLAWVVATGHQGSGYAGEAAECVMRWLRRNRVGRFAANIHPLNARSIGVARGLGLTATSTVVDGEVRWSACARCLTLWPLPVR